MLQQWRKAFTLKEARWSTGLKSLNGHNDTWIEVHYKRRNEVEVTCSLTACTAGCCLCGGQRRCGTSAQGTGHSHDSPQSCHLLPSSHPAHPPPAGSHHDTMFTSDIHPTCLLEELWESNPDDVIVMSQQCYLSMAWRLNIYNRKLELIIRGVGVWKKLIGKDRPLKKVSWSALLESPNFMQVFILIQ